MNRIHPIPTLALALLVLLFAGCVATNPTQPTPATAGRGDPDKLLPVDCLLPAQVRKLGTQMTYLAPRRAIKTTAQDCEIRGGEYVAYDRADYRTALNVWLARAKQGDPEAQTYVGEIYEKGLGLPADYQAARHWYQKAAEQGYARAQIDLGYLYEKGLGVKQDPVTALNWYRRASGIQGDDIEYASAIEVQAATLAQEQNELLRQEIQRREQEIKRLRASLQTAKRQLDESRHRLQKAKQRLQELQRKIHSTSDATRLKQLQAAYARQQQAIRESQQRLKRLQHQAEMNRQSLQRQAADVKTQKAQLVADEVAGPTIEVFDPTLAVTRGGEPRVRVRAGSKVRLISGRIRAPAGLRGVTINGAPVTPDSSGVFHSALSLSDREQKIVIQAEDKLGQNAEFSFLLVPDRSLAPRPVDNGLARRIAGSIDFGRYYALVIGNDEYRHLPDLQTAVNDAQTVTKLLRDKFGFQVRFLRNADRYTILSALNELKGELTPQDNLLIYYAGHGERDVKTLQGYWLPVDAEAQNTANWIPNAAISDLLNTMSAKHILVVADSCYSGSMTSSSVARLDTQLNDAQLKKWLKVMSRTGSRTVLTSGGVAPVLDTGGGRHSVFAQAFIDELRQAQGIIDAYKIYLKVSREVRQRAALVGFSQTPTYAPIRFAGHSGGEFIFVKS